jgi:hypothetical protein
VGYSVNLKWDKNTIKAIETEIKNGWIANNGSLFIKSQTTSRNLHAKKKVKIYEKNVHAC